MPLTTVSICRGRSRSRSQSSPLPCAASSDAARCQEDMDHPERTLG
jgi:hypothetical protein